MKSGINEVYADFGAYDWKVFNGVSHNRDKRLKYIRHLLAPVTSAKFTERMGSRLSPPDGYAKVTRYEDGINPLDTDNPNSISKAEKYFVYGDSAKRVATRSNVDKSIMYRWDYYGVAVALMIAEIYEAGTYQVSVRALHATKDISFVDRMENAVLGYWEVLTSKGLTKIEVVNFYPLEEQLGGLFRVAYTQRGMVNTLNPNKDKTTLVMDSGGHSTDVVAVDAGLNIDASTLRSIRVGTLDMMSSFDGSVRAKLLNQFPDTYRGSGEISPDLLEKAIITGKFTYGRHSVDVRDEADEVFNLIINDLMSIVDELGGASNYQVLLLTGGGAVLFGKKLKAVFPDLSIAYVEKERELMRFSNVVGASNFFKMLQRNGVIE